MTTASDAYNQGFDAGFDNDPQESLYDLETHEDLYNQWHAGFAEGYKCYMENLEDNRSANCLEDFYHYLNS